MNFIKKNTLSLISLAIMIGASVYYYKTLPSSVPTKFDINGLPISYSSKEFVVIMMPIIYLLLIGLINVLVKVSPQKFSMPNSKRAVDIILFGTGLLLLGIHMGLLVYAGEHQGFIKFFSFGAAFFLIIVGNVFGKTERNFFMGIRVPWTIDSEPNWKATHRFAGKLMVVFGIALLAASFFYSSMVFAISCILLPTIAPAFYSYWFYKNKKVISEGAQV